MSSAASRVFSACRMLLAPATPAPRASSATASRSRSTTGVAKTVKPKKATVKSSSSSVSSPRTYSKPTGILKVSPVSPALARFLGSGEASRTDTVKQIWVHIKSQNLQNPANKREIICDEKLKSLFNGKEKIGIFEIGKLLTPHFVKTS